MQSGIYDVILVVVGSESQPQCIAFNESDYVFGNVFVINEEVWMNIQLSQQLFTSNCWKGHYLYGLQIMHEFF